MNEFAFTMGVEDFDLTEQKVMATGDKVAMHKHTLPNMARHGFYIDTKGDIFEVHQPDENYNTM